MGKELVLNMNHEKVKLLGIKPERVRELVNQINEQRINTDLILQLGVQCQDKNRKKSF